MKSNQVVSLLWSVNYIIQQKGKIIISCHEVLVKKYKSENTFLNKIER